jgi:hypothetical protein
MSVPASSPPISRTFDAIVVGNGCCFDPPRPVGAGPALVGSASTYWSTAETSWAGFTGGSAAAALPAHQIERSATVVVEQA